MRNCCIKPAFTQKFTKSSLQATLPVWETPSILMIVKKTEQLIA